ncbi:MAG: hypothetical protein B7Z67_03210 [Acidiphilium sp. 21-60-14]|nr:MAG: hypothetical protein B7Z67_03210 [Acidiphilium sp. 21-60-14]OYV91103.1 MAG: hypothetical protein B7Z57_05505 [Acidiphilium sp. 37-60-79]
MEGSGDGATGAGDGAGEGGVWRAAPIDPDCVGADQTQIGLVGDIVEFLHGGEAGGVHKTLLILNTKRLADRGDVIKDEYAALGRHWDVTGTSLGRHWDVTGT